MITFANGLVADRDVGMGPTPQGSEEDKAKKRERESTRGATAQGTAAPQRPPGCAAGFVGPWPLVRPMAYTWALQFYYDFNSAVA